MYRKHSALGVTLSLKPGLKQPNFFISIRELGKISYGDHELKDLGINDDDISEYADLGLGKQIRDCIKENGACSFTAEL